MDALQRAVPIPQHEVGMRGAFRRQILRQRLPLAARREHVEDRVQNLADVHLASTPTVLSRRYRRFDQRPLAVAQITRVAQAVAVRSTAMFRLPHPASLKAESGAGQGITTDSSDSTTLWIGSKEYQPVIEILQFVIRFANDERRGPLRGEWTTFTAPNTDFYSNVPVLPIPDERAVIVHGLDAFSGAMSSTLQRCFQIKIDPTHSL